MIRGRHELGQSTATSSANSRAPRFEDSNPRYLVIVGMLAAIRGFEGASATSSANLPLIVAQVTPDGVAYRRILNPPIAPRDTDRPFRFFATSFHPGLRRTADYQVSLPSVAVSYVRSLLACAAPPTSKSRGWQA